MFPKQLLLFVVVMKSLVGIAVVNIYSYHRTQETAS